MKKIIISLTLLSASTYAMQDINQRLQALENTEPQLAGIIDCRNDLIGIHNNLSTEALPCFDVCFSRLCNLITNYTNPTALMKELNARIEALYTIRETYADMNKTQRIHYIRRKAFYSYCRDAVVKSGRPLRAEIALLVQVFDRLLNGIDRTICYISEGYYE